MEKNKIPQIIPQKPLKIQWKYDRQEVNNEDKSGRSQAAKLISKKGKIHGQNGGDLYGDL